MAKTIPKIGEDPIPSSSLYKAEKPKTIDPTKIITIPGLYFLLKKKKIFFFFPLKITLFLK